MANRLPFQPKVHPPATPRLVDSMSLGDVLYRLALVAPQDYQAYEILIRASYHRAWPLNSDPLDELADHG